MLPPPPHVNGDLEPVVLIGGSSGVRPDILPRFRLCLCQDSLNSAKQFVKSNDRYILDCKPEVVKGPLSRIIEIIQVPSNQDAVRMGSVDIAAEGLSENRIKLPRRCLDLILRLN